MEMKYVIGQQVMDLATQKISKVVAIDSEACWYRLSDSAYHYTEDQIAAYPEEVFYAVIVYDNIDDEHLLDTIIFKDKLKASMYMEDLFSGFDDPSAINWIKDFESGKFFGIWDKDNVNTQYSGTLNAVKITY